jgi:hypothetical protein
MKKRLNELQRHAAILHYWHLVSQTAEFRYRICWQGARELFTARGYDPSSVIQLTCDQGDDVHGTFVLADGKAIACDLREDPHTRQAVRFQSWQPLECSLSDGDDGALALQIFQEPHLRAAFDIAVQAFFDFHWRDIDEPLPAV